MPPPLGGGETGGAPPLELGAGVVVGDEAVNMMVHRGNQGVDGVQVQPLAEVVHNAR